MAASTVQLQRLVVASNRLPAVSVDPTSQRSRVASVGGLVSAVYPVLQQRGGAWFGWSGRTDAPNGPMIREKTGNIELVSLDLSTKEVDLYYNGFANATLWPLLHGFPSKAAIDRESYAMYEATNRKLAERLLPLLHADDLLWVHDYHLIPLGRELREMGWRGRAGWFLHTPFPPADVFAVLPWAPQLLDALSHYQLIGVHTKRYLRNLFDALSREIAGGALVGNTFEYGGWAVRIEAYPVGIDPSQFEDGGEVPTDSPVTHMFEGMPPDHKVVLGVDRLDYTKGIPYRLLAFERLLDQHPELLGKVSFVQISVPSRESVKEYDEERNLVDQLVGRINGRFSELNWSPIRYLYRSYPQNELRAFYRRAQVCMITPLADGMNLVAKEYVASQSEGSPGVLVLSRFCGAADTMREAVLVNPYDTDASADALYAALVMSTEERRERQNALMADVREFTAGKWSESFLNDLAATAPVGPRLAGEPV